MKIKKIESLLNASLLLLLFSVCSGTPSVKDTSSSEIVQVHPMATSIGTGEVDGYKLVWEDQFAENKLNENYWTPEVNGNGGGNNELQYYREENVSIEIEPESGLSCLVLTARKENFKDKMITSGRVITKNKVTFLYGKLEARIKLPKTSNGLWPAFWMMGNDIDSVGWPRCGETDILEMGHANGIKEGAQEQFFNGAYHWGTSWKTHRYISQEFTSGYGLQDGFHLFTLEWTPESLNMFLDKDLYPEVEPYFSLDIRDKGEGKPGHYVHKPNFILLNLAVGGDFPEIWDVDKVTALEEGVAKMYVDFVRIYQKESE